MLDDGLFAQAPPGEIDADDCFFYHRMDIPGHGVVGGQWDLRGHEDEYVGGVDLNGQRVLEIGPASGFLTFAMEARGAEVVAVDLPDESRWDVVPNPRLDPAAVAEWLSLVRRMKNGFWFAHRRHDSAARVHYGNVYDLPQRLGRFDVAVMAAVLLHVRDPLGVVAQCARLSDRLVITDMHVPELDGRPIQQLVPAVDAPHWDTWWRFSPELFEQFLAVLGFATTSLTFHEQLHLNDGAEYPMAMMTLVADRV
jgi:SAM-dependent methyltransferase